MPIIRFKEESDEPNRAEIIDNLLPKETLIDEILEPKIEERMFPIIAKCVREELEIYRAFPKRTHKEDKPREVEKSFSPLNNKTCFMGQAFKSNDEWVDAELVEYRKRVGTIDHPIWGNCTLLEIWAADHFKDHREMVQNAFNYGFGYRNTKPPIKVFVNPLFKNKLSGKFELDKEQKEYKKNMDDFMDKAFVNQWKKDHHMK